MKYFILLIAALILVGCSDTGNPVDAPTSSTPNPSVYEWDLGFKIDTIVVYGNCAYSRAFPRSRIQVFSYPDEIVLMVRWVERPDLPTEYNYSLREDGTFRDSDNYSGLRIITGQIYCPWNYVDLNHEKIYVSVEVPVQGPSLQFTLYYDDGHCFKINTLYTGYPLYELKLPEKEGLVSVVLKGPF